MSRIVADISAEAARGGDAWALYQLLRQTAAATDASIASTLVALVAFVTELSRRLGMSEADVVELVRDAHRHP